MGTVRSRSGNSMSRSGDRSGNMKQKVTLLNTLITIDARNDIHNVTIRTSHTLWWSDGSMSRSGNSRSGNSRSGNSKSGNSRSIWIGMICALRH